MSQATDLHKSKLNDSFHKKLSIKLSQADSEQDSMSMNNNNQPRVKKDRKNSQQVFREDNSARITFQEQTVNPGLLGFDTENSTPQTLEFPTSGNNNSV